MHGAERPHDRYPFFPRDGLRRFADRGDFGGLRFVGAVSLPDLRAVFDARGGLGDGLFGSREAGASNLLASTT